MLDDDILNYALIKFMKNNYFVAALRISLGFIFFWAFLDKLFGLGFATTAEKSWLAGGSPTSGFLGNAVSGPFAETFHKLAGVVAVDWLFMIGLLLIGIALILGIGMKIATYAGSLLLFMMWLSLLLPENNPVIDDHIIYILTLFVLKSLDAGKIFGFGKAWSKMGIVKKFPILE